MSKLSIVGIGPGDYDNMTVRADRVLRECDTIIGYTVYVDLVKERYPGKEFRSTPMTREVDRCRMALDAAREGKQVAMVCSGDSGIYGMAALIYELRGESAQPAVEVVPGLTAACSGAALLGAPLTHDFAVISLSDYLTPWDKIEARLEAAATSDLTVVLYNPVSRTRPQHLKQACEILLRRLPADRLCGVVRNIGREGESARLLTLAALRDDTEVDMFSTVFVGNAQTRVIGGKLVTPRGYRDV
ncbi:MAG: precorrin-3B C(17)-methyltransferase [Clostridia bacterium]|nr:precorrin-3B C(17)-methyltransferase [Clostridia bacterium]